MSSYQIPLPTADEPQVVLDTLLIKKAGILVKALNHPLRQQLLQLIGAGTKLSVTELIAATGEEQSIVSQHLATLRKTGFVRTERQGRNIFYLLNIDALQHLDHFVKGLLKQ